MPTWGWPGAMTEPRAVLVPALAAMTEPRAVVVPALTAIACLALTACNGDTSDAFPGSPGVNGVRYLAGGDDAAGFARATEPREFTFPADHGAHPAFRTEWWYFTGNVFDDDDRHYGFELTMFRVALAAAPAPRESSLATGEVWMAHLAVTDTARQQFQVAERLSRGAAGLAGAAAGLAGAAAGVPGNVGANGSAGSPVIAVEDFSIGFDGDKVSLAAGDSGFGIDLELSGLERIVAQGDRGLDPKGPEPGNASFYFSAPRLSVRGALESANAAPVAVRGTAWMDREWSTSALSPDIAGWDWFALQLDDGRDLMFYRLRGDDGSTSRFSGGTITDAAGTVTRLGAGSVELAASRHWSSPATNVSYPVDWQLRVPAADLALDLKPRLDDQEIDVSVRYWEGAVTVSGTAAGRPIGGVGYLELAGY